MILVTKLNLTLNITNTIAFPLFDSSRNSLVFTFPIVNFVLPLSYRTDLECFIYYKIDFYFTKGARAAECWYMRRALWRRFIENSRRRRCTVATPDFKVRHWRIVTPVHLCIYQMNIHNCKILKADCHKAGQRSGQRR